MNPKSIPRVQLDATFLGDEAVALAALGADAAPDAAALPQIERVGRQLVDAMRTRRGASPGLEAFLRHYDLSSREGVVLMCLAEALLRVPDAATADRLIADKLSAADWRRHLGASESLFVNASTWALLLTGRMIELGGEARQPADFALRLLSRLDDPVIRGALRAAMRIMASQFVMGRDIDAALARAAEPELRRWRFSFDMLGEAAVTEADAQRYLDAYAGAIHALGEAAAGTGAIRPGISVKLSALHPRFDWRQRDRAVHELSARLLQLARLAADAQLQLTVDAEEADRLEPTLAVLRQVFLERGLDGWSGLGIAVQAYQKRAPAVIDWLQRLAESGGRTIPVRLVKGAYWDSEIKRAQEQGLADYPVFTRKCNTDISYLACARRLLRAAPRLYPQFATHNAHSVAWIHAHAGSIEFEFQRLHGMGTELHEVVTDPAGLARPCRVYAPVGAHEDLLPYLVRRLLENGANTSFVNQMARATDPGRLLEDPRQQAAAGSPRHPFLPPPALLFGAERRNSAGVNFADAAELDPLLDAVRSAAARPQAAAPLVPGVESHGVARALYDPADGRRMIGRVSDADAETAQRALDIAAGAWPEWEAVAAAERAAILERAADLFEARRAGLVALCVREGGRSVVDACGELREAVDFLRYYAVECRRRFASAQLLRGPVGECNELSLRGRGVFACISPWNFPLAIFTGQVAAALAAGNTVIAKPAEQTPLTAMCAVQLLHEAGVPRSALCLLPGDGAALGRVLLSDARTAGVAFTGSTETAAAIQRQLAARAGPQAVLIAETGGLNALLADSSALPEQLVQDALVSAFNSAGQRCSALRVLYLQQEISDRVLRLLIGAMDELCIGDPLDPATDVGPVIDAVARETLEQHVVRMQRAARVLHRCRLPAACAHGQFVAPTLVELDEIGQLAGEVFGPVLHVVRYPAGELDRVIDQVNGCGYGLTFGLHSRINAVAEHVRRRVRAGNLYVNRNLIGAAVGVQPFGGMGLSGTGPKAGGPHYLARFAVEQTYTVNTAAVGGNATLLSMDQ